MEEGFDLGDLFGVIGLTECRAGEEEFALAQGMVSQLDQLFATRRQGQNPRQTLVEEEITFADATILYQEQAFAVCGLFEEINRIGGPVFTEVPLTILSEFSVTRLGAIE
jgi:hypothetical protein